MDAYMVRLSSQSHTVLVIQALSLGRSTGGPQRWRVAKVTVTHKLKVNGLMLLLSSMDGLLLRDMHVFRSMESVHEQFVSGILHVLNILLSMFTLG